MRVRMVEHVFAEIALGAVAARFGGLVLHVAILAAGDIFSRGMLVVFG
jgi:hypothetical protein